MDDPAKTSSRMSPGCSATRCLGEAVAAVGTAEQAAAEYRLLAPYAGRIPCLGNITRPSITLVLATLAARAGRKEQAEQHFNDSSEQHLQLGAIGWLARTQFAWARFLLDDGETERVRALLAEARDGAARMGAADVSEAIIRLDAEAPRTRKRGVNKA